MDDATDTPGEAWHDPGERQKSYVPMSVKLPPTAGTVGQAVTMRIYYLKSPIKGAQVFWEVRGITGVLMRSDDAKAALRGSLYIHRRERTWKEKMANYEVFRKEYGFQILFGFIRQVFGILLE